MTRIIIAIGAGSFIGGVTRFLLGRFIQTTTTGTFPYGTLAVNLIGCFLIGLFFAMTERGHLMNNEWRLFLTVGICGGFTTFSTFSIENMALLKGGNFLSFAIYTGLSVFLGLTATYVGYLSMKAV